MPPKKRKTGDGENPAGAEPVGTPPTPNALPVVGIGASAGGLEALEAFLGAMPAGCGMAFVVVAHLDPTHVSIMPELLQNRTTMPVSQVKDRTRVLPGHVYVIPPNSDLEIVKGTLRLVDPARPRGPNLPIDTFLRSLATDQGRNAICVILSGTGTDGTLGLKAVKGEAGMAMVQSEESARYDGMPRSAIATGLVDYVLAPSDMPEHLIRYTERAIHAGLPRIEPTEGPVPDALQKIFGLLRARTSHDFSLYKKNTICRRIERRMNVHQIDEITDYVRYVQRSEHEVEILFKELLIGVTNFFRDPEAFDALRDRALPALLRDKPEEYTIRVWVPGCSSGEEAYSVAMVIHECLGTLGRHRSVQVFGTDIDEQAIAVARAGVYPESIAADVGDARLKRFFSKDDSGRYRVRKTIREALVFAVQNVIKDPPFTKLDLLCCRNLLIYLGSELQRKLLPAFHYSLKPDGLLFLGSSETIGSATDLFASVDKKWKIYRRKPSSVGSRPVLDLPGPRVLRLPDMPAPDRVLAAEKLSAFQLVETILQQSSTPPCVIIDEASEIVYVHGPTGRFLQPAEGRASHDVLEMARTGLRTELASAIRRVTSHRQEVAQRELRIQHETGDLFLDLIVRPILEPAALRGLMMIIFEEVAPSPAGAAPVDDPAGGSERSVVDLERELRSTRENLQSTIEELETSNEELRSTNEELQSTNEELQSTNEELETSKEELQSLNEETTTVNAELQSRIDELSRAHDDMKNLLDSTEIATIFLDTDLCVLRFTPRATEIIPLAITDAGRPITHFATKLVQADLGKLAGDVLRDLAIRKVETESRDGRWFNLTIRPYRTVANVIDGVVMTFQDITEHRLVERDLRRLAAVLRDSDDAITLQEADGRILAWNRGAERMYGYSERDALAMNIREIVPKGKRREINQVIRRVLAGISVEPIETDRVGADRKRRRIWLKVNLLRDDGGEPLAIATVERDVTERIRAEEERERLVTDYEATVAELRSRLGGG